MISPLATLAAQAAALPPGPVGLAARSIQPAETRHWRGAATEVLAVTILYPGETGTRPVSLAQFRSDRKACRSALADQVRLVLHTAGRSRPILFTATEGAPDTRRAPAKEGQMNAPVLACQFASSEPGMAAELQRVILTAPTTTDDVEVPTGTSGTVVGVWTKGATCEVDFPLGLATVEASKLVLA